MTTTSDILATIDFMPFVVDEGCVVGDAPTLAQIEVAAQIDRIMCDHGFLYVTNLGVTEDEVAAAFEASKALFSSGQLAPYVSEKNMGHTKMRQLNLNHARPADLVEGFAIKSHRCHDNDYSGCPAGFESLVDSLWDKLEDASRRFSVALALAMGLPSDELNFFSQSHTTMENATLKFNHYPPCDFQLGVTDGASSSGAIRIGEHADFGLFTFLLLDGVAPGLQVKKSAQGAAGAASGISGCPSLDWIDAPGRGGSAAIVNSGDLLARFTNDRWRATAHRVVVPSAEEAAKHRYSIPFFVQPDLQTMVAPHPLFVPDGEQPRYAPITVGDHLRMKVKAMQGAKAVCASSGGS